jgi:IS5 family transposase
MWLINELSPENKTICNFRRENAENIIRFYNEFVKALAGAGYIEGKVVAVDGTKIRANNSRRNNFSVKKLDRHIEYINKKITEYMGELDKNDKIEELEQRKERYIGYKNRIESGEVSEVSVTDRDSRMMKASNGGKDVSYNVQATVDSKHKLIAGVLVTNTPNDQGQLHNSAKAVKDNLGLKDMTVLGDKGYYSTEDIKKCHDDGITTIVAKPDKKDSDDALFKKEEFIYDKDTDSYTCPAGQILRFSAEDKCYMRYRNVKACNKCALKSLCTKGNRKDICRHVHEEHAEQNDSDFEENTALYRTRQELSEHPFGTIKRTMGIRQFLLRGLVNVNAEAALIFLAYNLKRLRNIDNTDNKKDDRFVLPIAYLLFYTMCYMLRLKTVYVD